VRFGLCWRRKNEHRGVRREGDHSDDGGPHPSVCDHQRSVGARHRNDARDERQEYADDQNRAGGGSIGRRSHAFRDDGFTASEQHDRAAFGARRAARRSLGACSAADPAWPLAFPPAGPHSRGPSIGWAHCLTINELRTRRKSHRHLRRVSMAGAPSGSGLWPGGIPPAPHHRVGGGDRVVELRRVRDCDGAPDPLYRRVRHSGRSAPHISAAHRPFAGGSGRRIPQTMNRR